MHWTLLGDHQKSLTLVEIQVTPEFDLDVNLIQHSLLRFAVATIFGVNAVVPKLHRNGL